jgi:hypothetical protein
VNNVLTYEIVNLANFCNPVEHSFSPPNAMARNGCGKARRTTDAIILDSGNELGGALNNDSHPMTTPPVPMQPEKSAQVPNPNTDDDDSDNLPLRVMATDDFPICRGVKRKSSELGTGMNV